jgi:putative phage-type endonuclease
MIREISYGSKTEWLELRKHYIGGSDAGSVVGMNPYRGAYALWAEKTGQLPGFEGNLATEVGSYLEEFVAKKFEAETGKRVRRKNRMLVNDKYPFACADVDRVIVGEDAILECKTTSSPPVMRALRKGGDEFPEIYYAQCVHYLAVTEKQRVYLAVLVSNREFRRYILERDEAEIEALMNAERDFWARVKNKIPPAVDGSDSCSETLETIYARETGETVPVYGLEGQIRAYLAYGEQVKAVKAMQTEAANAIKAALGNNSYGECTGYKVSWTETNRSSFDTKAFQQAYTGIDLTPFYKNSVSRTLRIKEI